jgi:hypothetical protein
MLVLTWLRGAKYLVRLLHRWLRRFSKHTPRDIKRLFRFRFPAVGQVLDWASVLLDAHFMTLALTPAAVPALRRLADLVKRELTLCSALRSPLSVYGSGAERRGRQTSCTRWRALCRTCCSASRCPSRQSARSTWSR